MTRLPVKDDASVGESEEEDLPAEKRAVDQASDKRAAEPALGADA